MGRRVNNFSVATAATRSRTDAVVSAAMRSSLSPKPRDAYQAYNGPFPVHCTSLRGPTHLFPPSQTANLSRLAKWTVKRLSVRRGFVVWQ
jgi:hypothetical protein